MTQAAILSSLGSSGISTGFKNRIINGAMVIDQRNAGTSVTPTDGTYTIDRYLYKTNLSGKLTIQQIDTGGTLPAFPNALKVVSSSSYSVLTGDWCTISQYIEGYNIADLGWGSSSAKTVTLSFWTYSSLTGTFGGAIQNSAANRSYPFSYTISSANTWEYKTVTIAGDTSGTWLTTNGIGMRVRFNLGTGSTYANTSGAWVSGDYETVTGSVNVIGTNGATWYLTGLQLEVGTTATNFEYRDYGNELRMCQRYYQVSAPDGPQIVGVAYYLTSSQVNAVITFQTTMRTKPTLVSTSGTDYYGMARTNSADYFNSITLAASGTNACVVRNTTEAAGTAGDAGYFGTDAAAAYIGWNAEL